MCELFLLCLNEWADFIFYILDLWNAKASHFSLCIFIWIVTFYFEWKVLFEIMFSVEWWHPNTILTFSNVKNTNILDFSMEYFWNCIFKDAGNNNAIETLWIRLSVSKTVLSCLIFAKEIRKVIQVTRHLTLLFVQIYLFQAF